MAGSCSTRATGRARPTGGRLNLYVTTGDVESLYRQLEERVEVVEPLHDTFYGMREFIIRGLNRFLITFGQDLP